MMRLNEIRDNPGARCVPKIVGRGIGSGLGKTCGMGHKGQHARCGHGLNGFEGGQTPIYRRLPKRGFVNIFRQKLFEIDFYAINRILDKGIVAPGGKIDCALLVQAGIVPHYAAGLSLINNGKPKSAVNLAITRASAKAREALEALGGRIEIE
jgi:large subunit ribosomal protein L15